MMEGHFLLRRFAGFTPWNAADRVREVREAAEPLRLRPCARWFHYGAITWVDMFLATRRGIAYRAGDAGRGTLRRRGKTLR